VINKGKRKEGPHTLQVEVPCGAMPCNTAWNADQSIRTFKNKNT